MLKITKNLLFTLILVCISSLSFAETPNFDSVGKELQNPSSPTVELRLLSTDDVKELKLVESCKFWSHQAQVALNFAEVVTQDFARDERSSTGISMVGERLKEISQEVNDYYLQLVLRHQSLNTDPVQFGFIMKQEQQVLYQRHLDMLGNGLDKEAIRLLIHYMLTEVNNCYSQLISDKE